jgi:endonuclease/exonuclease/phosphatase (EEP) superfamily protein YafD
MFKVLTFNLDRDSYAHDEAISVIVSADAHLVCLQETTDGWEEALRAHLSDQYPIMVFRNTGGPGGMGFLSRLEIREVDWFPPVAGGWFPAGLVQLRTGFGDVHVVNLHLRPPYFYGSRKNFVPLAYFLLSIHRWIEIHERVKNLERRRPLILAGDFNEGPYGLALSWLKWMKGFRCALSGNERQCPTWFHRTKYLTLTARIDHILYTDELRCAEARVLADAGSDHRPVEAVFYQ